MKHKTHTRKYAEEQGFTPISDPYTAKEHELLERALDNLKGIVYLLVDEGGKKVSIYRRKSEVRFSRGPAHA